MTLATPGGAVAAVIGEVPVPSPCINVCRMDAASGLCEGCLRTLDEIATWSQMSGGEKLAVWAALEARRATRPGGAVSARPASPTPLAPPASPTAPTSSTSPSQGDA